MQLLSNSWNRGWKSPRRLASEWNAPQHRQVQVRWEDFE
jgi:hypothetical protein